MMKYLDAHLEVGGKNLIVLLDNLVQQLLAVLLGLGLHVLRDLNLVKLHAENGQDKGERSVKSCYSR